MTFDVAMQHLEWLAREICDLQSMQYAYRRKKTAGRIRRFLNLKTRNELNLFDRLEHLECGLVCADKKTLEVFTQTLALQCVATGALFFSSHDDLFNGIANSERGEL